MMSYHDKEFIQMFLEAGRYFEEKEKANPDYDHKLRLRLHKKENILVASFDKYDKNGFAEMTLENNIVQGFQEFCQCLRQKIAHYEKDMHELFKVMHYESLIRIINRLIKNEDCEDTGEIIERIIRWKKRMLEVGPVKGLQKEFLEFIVQEQWGEVITGLEKAKLQLKIGQNIKITGTRALSQFYKNEGLLQLLITPIPFYASTVEAYASFRQELETAANYDGIIYFSIR